MAEEKEQSGGRKGDEEEPKAPDVEVRLSKLEKALTDTAKILEEERRASAGKDKKITELSAEKKNLQESTLSKDKLLEIREKELEEKEAETAAKNAAERLELESLRTEMLRHKVLTKLENFPTFLADRVRGNTEEDIEADARGLMKHWVKDRDKVDNVRKVTGRPKSGDGKQLGRTADDVRSMSPKEMKEWAATASEEEYAEVFDDISTNG
jgi:hypothetical protein